MKTMFMVVCILATNLAVLLGLAHHYEFHTGINGSIIWRCNNFTGKVERSSFGENKWVAVSDSKPIRTNRDGFEIVEPASTPALPTWENTKPKTFIPDAVTNTDESVGILVTNQNTKQ